MCGGFVAHLPTTSQSYLAPGVWRVCGAIGKVQCKATLPLMGGVLAMHTAGCTWVLWALLPPFYRFVTSSSKYVQFGNLFSLMHLHGANPNPILMVAPIRKFVQPCGCAVASLASALTAALFQLCLEFSRAFCLIPVRFSHYLETGKLPVFGFDETPSGNQSHCTIAFGIDNWFYLVSPTLNCQDLLCIFHASLAFAGSANCTVTPSVSCLLWHLASKCARLYFSTSALTQ